MSGVRDSSGPPHRPTCFSKSARLRKERASDSAGGPPRAAVGADLLGVALSRSRRRSAAARHMLVGDPDRGFGLHEQRRRARGAAAQVAQRSSRLSSIQAAGRCAGVRGRCASSFQWEEPNTARPSKVRTGRSAGRSRRWTRYSLAFSSQPVAQTSSKPRASTRQAGPGVRADAVEDAVDRMEACPAGCREGSKPNSEITPSTSTKRTGRSSLSLLRSLTRRLVFRAHGKPHSPVAWGIVNEIGCSLKLEGARADSSNNGGNLPPSSFR